MRVLLSTALILFLALETSTVFAGISVSTGVIETAAYKGKEVSRGFVVVNPGKSTAKINIGIVNFSGKDPDPSVWLAIKPMDFSLKAGEKREVFCRIKPPVHREGELRARLYISAKDLDTDATSVGVRFNMPVYVAVQGTIKLGAGIEDIDVRYDDKNNKIEGDLFINNRSNVHIRPEVKLTVKDLKDNLIGDIFVPFGQPVQQEETRMFIFKRDMNLDPGRYKMIVNVDYGILYGLKGFTAVKEIEFEIK